MRIRTIVILMIFCAPLHGQNMTVEEAIKTARRQSVEALEARNEFISAYWQYRSYKASLLPSVNLYGAFMSFDRSLTLLQDYNTGEMKYTKSYHLQNSAGVRISQNVAFTGGKLSVYSDLSRMDQFGNVKGITWYSQPFTLYYTQPLFAYNQFKWDRKISPKEYELGKRKYIESMEMVTINAVEHFYNLLLAKINYEMAKSNYENTNRLKDIAQERMKLGRVTKDELLQLDLNVLKDSIKINESSVKIHEAQMLLNSLLGYDESFEINPIIENLLPNVVMNYDLVMEKALDNSSFSVENTIRLLNAASEVAKAQANRGLSVSLSARFGLSKSDSKLRGVYRSPLDQEVVGLSFSLPLFDWGLGKGRVQKAKAAEDVVKAKVLQGENDYRRKIFTVVSKFNNQRQQCLASQKAREIAQERYDLVVAKFRMGKATVTDLINAQNEKDSAVQQHITDISNFWIYYYSIRQLTLFDFINGKDVNVDFEEMIK